MQFDWSILKEVGLGGVALALIFFGYKVIMFLLEQWRASTEALNRNTDGYTKLSEVFEKSHEREMEFQEKMLELTKDTNKKVSELHSQVIKQKVDKQIVEKQVIHKN